jgi:hypothetical protein
MVRICRNAERACMYAGDLSAMNFRAYDQPSPGKFPYGCLVEIIFKGIVSLPQRLEILKWNTHSPLINLPCLIHLLLFFPLCIRLQYKLPRSP